MMKRPMTIAALAASLFVLSCGSVPAEALDKYAGVKTCAICHKAEARGNQYGRWFYSAHAKAYKRLASPEARETAAKAGIVGDPQQIRQCLKCHITAMDVDSNSLGDGFDMSDGVQCEACHGSGRDSASLCSMKRSKTKSISEGLIIPIKEVCTTCHNPESPNFKGFNFDEYMKKIAHPKPKKK